MIPKLFGTNVSMLNLNGGVISLNKDKKMKNNGSHYGTRYGKKYYKW